MLERNFKIAVISDIHGNRWALEAVLRDIKERSIDRIVNLGDSVFGPLDPAGTIEMLADPNILSISGNDDEIIFQAERDKNETVNFVKNKLSPEQLIWLEELPDDLVLGEEILFIHGSPEDKREYFLQKVDSGCLSCRSTGEIKQKMNGLEQSIVICGHSHLPELYRFSDGRIVLNPGSVGLQAFTEDDPFHHVQNGSPYARYSILRRIDGKWKIEKVELPYNWEAASREALRNGRLDWCEWLITGKVRNNRCCYAS